MPPQLLEIVSSLAALGALALSVFALFWRSARLSGRDEERIGALESEVKELNQAVLKVSTLDKDVAVIAERLTAFDRLTTRALDELTRGMTRLEARSFDPAPARAKTGQA